MNYLNLIETIRTVICAFVRLVRTLGVCPDDTNNEHTVIEGTTRHTQEELDEKFKLFFPDGSLVDPAFNLAMGDARIARFAHLLTQVVKDPGFARGPAHQSLVAKLEHMCCHADQFGLTPNRDRFGDIRDDNE